MHVSAIYLSPGHNYFGHHGRDPSTHRILSVPTVECVAGKGLRGDRFFGYRDNYPGQITFFANEVYQSLCDEFGLPDRSPDLLRRNVITRGIDLNELIGKEFTLQGIRFAGAGECKPCYWMDAAFAPGTERSLQGRGGLRARILSNGWLSVPPDDFP